MPTLGYAHLVYISCAPRDAEAVEFSRKEERAASALQHTLSEQLQENAIFVGGIGLKALLQFYFYTSDANLIQRVTTLCRAEPHLQVTCGHVAETHYATYYCLLFPDDAKLQSVENAAYIKSVQHRDGDVSLVRRVNLLMAFTTEQACDRFIEEVPHVGFTVGLRQSVGNATHPYRVMISGFSTLQLFDLNRCTTRAIRSALPFQGVLDHVEADFIEKH